LVCARVAFVAHARRGRDERSSGEVGVLALFEWTDSIRQTDETDRTLGAPRVNRDARRRRRRGGGVDRRGEGSKDRTMIRPGDAALALAVASFWRGTWYVLDSVVYPDDVVKSSAVCGIGGVATVATATHALRSSAVNTPCVRFYLGAYALAIGSVATWRGVWTAWDAAFEAYNSSLSPIDRMSDARVHAVSGLCSHALAAGALVSGGAFAATFAPPISMTRQHDATVAAERKMAERMTWLLRRVRV